MKLMKMTKLMAALSPEQTAFLKKQEIPPSKVFDASRMSRAQYSQIMRELELIIAFGVTPCGKAGHTLRTSAGHCAQCNTQAIAFIRRTYNEGDVYVARSDRAKLVKVGVASDAKKRMHWLNDYRYGDAEDWILVYSRRVPKAGRIEFLIHSDLVRYAKPSLYTKFGKQVWCKETYACSSSTAVRAVNRRAAETLTDDQSLPKEGNRRVKRR